MTSQDDLVKVEKWCRDNDMVSNHNRTTCMLIGTKIRLKQTRNLKVPIAPNEKGVYLQNKSKPHLYHLKIRPLL